MKNCWKFYKFYYLIRNFIVWGPALIPSTYMFVSLCSFFLSSLTIVHRLIASDWFNPFCSLVVVILHLHLKSTPRVLNFPFWFNLKPTKHDLNLARSSSLHGIKNMKHWFDTIFILGQCQLSSHWNQWSYFIAVVYTTPTKVFWIHW